MVSRALAFAVLAVTPHILAAQEWNSAAASALADRAVQRRRAEIEAVDLRDFRARAHGFVFFLAQLGEGLSEPPRLIKTDQLELEVYWRAPGASKQRIVGWRDRVDLPTEISYHRDHLGIVQNGFADRIRLGEGAEVRDVPHPLSPAGQTLYDFAIADSLTIGLPDRVVRVFEVLTRPKDFDVPRVVGALYLDVETAELVRFRFNFTRSAYLDRSLEDITILLENALWEGRYWLPRRQEIEIRRRTEWLDLPARGIIRGRWEINEYAFNTGLPDSLFRGAEIVAAPRAVRDTFRWEGDLPAALGELRGPELERELERVRAEIATLAGRHVLNGLATARPSVGSLSDLIHFNRVEGLALGAGYLFRPGRSEEIRVGGAYGFGDERVKGAIDFAVRWPRATVRLRAFREVRDIGDHPVVSGAVNSIYAQEAGKDFGDYILSSGGNATLERSVGGKGNVGLRIGYEHVADVAVSAAPAWGSFRPNPVFGGGDFWSTAISAGLSSSDFARGTEWSVRMVVEEGSRESARYWRARAELNGLAAAGPTTFHGAGWVGAGTRNLPLHRSFVMGGRGTLLGEPFRAYWGRHAAWAALEWRLPVPVPAIPLGPFASTGRFANLAPFVAVGWVGDDRTGAPLNPSAGVRPVAGVAIELFHRLLRTEVGVGLRDGGVGVGVDLRRDLWGVL